MLYHISPNAYAQGEVVNVADFAGTTLYHKGLDDEGKAIDDYLSAERPEGEPARNHCIYVFDKMEYCVYFRSKELLTGGVYYLYKCKMDNHCGHPMMLVGKIRTVIEQDREKLRNEYWNPTKNWKIKEYLSDKIEILEEIPITPELRTRSMMKGRSDYSEDYDRVNYLLNHK